MSLQATANLLQQQGRGDDTVLVHMTPREVGGLEAIARAKGGQLTINPQTGLPEAGFLDDVLPIAASAALMYFGGPIGASIGEGLGLSGALAQGVGMGLLTGGATTLLTGDVNKGLKAGLTAGALSGAMAGLSGPSSTPTPTSNVETATPALQAASSTNAATVTNGLEKLPQGVSQSANLTGAAAPTATPAASTSEKSWWGSLSPKEKLGYGLAGTAGLSLLGGMQDKGEATPTDKGTIRPYTYSTAMRQPQAGQSQYFQPIQYDLAGRTLNPIDTSERTYFNQSYTALPTYKAAAGGEVPPNLDHMQPGGLAAIQGVRDGYAPVTTPNGDIPQMANGGAIAFREGREVKSEDDSQEELLRKLKALEKLTAQEQSDEEYLKRRAIEADIPESYERKTRFSGIPMMIDPKNKIVGGRLGADIPFGKDTVSAGVTGMAGNLGDRYGAKANAVDLGYTTKAGPGYLQGQIMRDLASRQNRYNVNYAIPFAEGGLGGYSDGGRMLKGPGDGMSDSIPGTINNKQPARLADGEFVVPADVVSHLGNGSTDAGAKRLYDMMDRVRKARTGTKKQGKQIKADKYLPK